MRPFILFSILCGGLALSSSAVHAQAEDPLPLPSGGANVASEDLAIAVPTPVLPSTTLPSDSTRLLDSEVDSPAAPGSASPAPKLVFDGVINTSIDIAPPDTHIAVGPGEGSTGRVVMVTNSHAAIWDKNGGVVAADLALDAMFGADVFDPKVLYDQHSGRFFVVALEGKNTTPGTSNIHIAVSSGDAPDDLGSDWTFSFGSAVTTVDGDSTWADYPGIGADASALFVTANLFTFAAPVEARGVKIRVFDKAALAAGSYSFVDIDYANAVSGGIPIATVQPVHTFGSTLGGNFYLVGRINASSYRLIEISGHPATPVATTGVFGWTGGAFPADDGADQCSVANPDVDTLSSRVQNAVYRNGQIWLALTADPDNDFRTEVVWQQIATNAYPNASPSVTSWGFIDGTGTDPWTYMPAIGVNAKGDVAITYTQSSASECPNMYYATREAGDTPGSLRDPYLARTSDGFYDSFRSNDPDRWGDYAAVAIDPDDGCFWVASEFVYASAAADSDWGTHVAQVCIPPDVPALPPVALALLAILFGAIAAYEVRRRRASLR